MPAIIPLIMLGIMLIFKIKFNIVVVNARVIEPVIIERYSFGVIFEGGKMLKMYVFC